MLLPYRVAFNRLKDAGRLPTGRAPTDPPPRQSKGTSKRARAAAEAACEARVQGVKRTCPQWVPPASAKTSLEHGDSYLIQF